MPKRVRKPSKQYRAPKTNVYRELSAMFASEDLAREWLEARRWPEGPICPHCGVINRAYRLQAKEGSTRPRPQGCLEVPRLPQTVQGHDRHRVDAHQLVDHPSLKISEGWM